MCKHLINRALSYKGLSPVCVKLHEPHASLSSEVIKADIGIVDSEGVQQIQYRLCHHRRTAEVVLDILGSVMLLEIALPRAAGAHIRRRMAHPAHTTRTHEIGLGLVTRRLCRMAHKKYGLSQKEKKIKGAFLFSSDHRAREIKSSTLCVRVPAFSLWHSGGLYEAFHARVV